MASYFQSKSVERALFNYKTSLRYGMNLYGLLHQGKEDQQKLMDELFEDDYPEETKASA